MNRPMRVLFLADGLLCGGKERQLVELATGLVRSKRMLPEDVLVVSMDNEGHYDRSLTAAGIRIERVIRHSQWDPFFPFRLRRVFAGFRPNIIHSFSLMGSVYASVTPKPKKCRLIDGCIRDAFPKRDLKERLLYRLAFSLADLIVANSKAGLEAKQAFITKRAVLYNGFDFHRIEGLRVPKALRSELGLPMGPVVGMVASFSAFKDWDTFFETARLVRARRPEVAFLAIGDGSTLEHYRSVYGREPGIFFAGRRDNVEEIVQLFDVGVLCSHGEGIPNAVMEYMALGKPAVVTDGGGIMELVLDGETGFVVPPQDPKVMATRIFELLENSDRAKSMGEAGRRRIMEHFSMESALNALCAMYAGLLHKTSPQYRHGMAK